VKQLENKKRECRSTPSQKFLDFLLIYDLNYDSETNCYRLNRYRTVYTLFQSALERIATPEPGSIEDFISHLQDKLDERLDNPPDAPTLLDLL
jgi:hypothetical protein